MRPLPLLLLLLMLCHRLIAAEGKAVSERLVPEAVKSAAAKVLPDARKLEYRLLEQGNYLSQAATGRDHKVVEIGADGTVVRTSEQVAAPPAAVLKRFETAMKDKGVKGKAREWQLVTEAATGKKHYDTTVGAKRSTYLIEVVEDGSAATVSVIETRLDDAGGLRVRVSKGGSIER